MDSRHGTVRENNEKEMTMESVNLFGRDVIPITTMQGQRNYYDYMNYWRSCVHNTNLRILPTEEEVGEYLNLKEEKPSMFGHLAECKRLILSVSFLQPESNCFPIILRTSLFSLML